ncbi:sodium/proline symporter [Oceanobacillus caeni]|uniref:Sodium/proline symporter n=1 Tax=Oceanobacillus caeni TaxID=405946 RepID=A0ABR5MKW8_9BACI|nr:sodium/proline symporter [Oceanobacillus caeni]KKE80028.1 sodium:proline symporter [Bacilli bacterium VT-13-104]PZD86450.1 sodium/proline symporter [Bacilli bacterium]KPH76539.1 sodium:proline symporter [Oceanobacillus caeni]MCR1834740.1 sodium/proline symporter [Oceanobacillus caeni]PZD88100.1 sodium/proline symporter [Bacilli bacterium]
MSLDGVIFIIYILTLLMIGLWFSRKSSESSEQYLLGGRSLGPAVTAMTMQTTAMSGYMFMGAPALAFQYGWYAVWYAIGDAGGSIVNLSVLGKRMRRMSELLGALSPIEYLEKRFEHASVRVVGSIISIVFLFAYVCAQFIAAGKAMATLTGFPYEMSLIIGISVIIIYTVAGGYLAVAYTAFVQGIIMVAGVVGIGVLAYIHVGGLTSLNTALGNIDPTYLSIWGKDLAFYGQWGVVLGAILIFSIGYMGLPHVVVRHMSMQSTKTVKGAILIGAIWNQFFIFVPYILGLAGILLIPTISDPEMIITELAYTLFPGFFAALLLSAVMSAVMSTCDSLLIQAGTILSRDVYQRFINKNAKEKTTVLVSRLCILGGGIVGIVVAIFEPPSIFGLAVFAFGTLGNAFLVPYVASVYSKKANYIGCLCAMIGGATTNIIWTSMDLEAVTGLHPFLAGLLVSLIGMIIGSRFGRKPSQPILTIFEQSKNKRSFSTQFDQNIARSLAPEAKNISKFLAKESGSVRNSFS